MKYEISGKLAAKMSRLILDLEDYVDMYYRKKRVTDFSPIVKSIDSVQEEIRETLREKIYQDEV